MLYVNLRVVAFFIALYFGNDSICHAMVTCFIQRILATCVWLRKDAVLVIPSADECARGGRLSLSDPLQVKYGRHIVFATVMPVPRYSSR